MNVSMESTRAIADIAQHTKELEYIKALHLEIEDLQIVIASLKVYIKENA